MKITSTILFDFIHDFRLDVSEVGVCFDAIIGFNFPDKIINLQSEVHMESILSNRIDAIYFLNTNIGFYKMPTFFNDVNNQFTYLKNRGLLINGRLPDGGTYSISVFPKSLHCSKQTSNELRAKKFN